MGWKMSRIQRIVEANRQILRDMKNGTWKDPTIAHVYPSQPSVSAEGVLFILEQRKGFGSWWNEIDKETQREIVEKLDGYLSR